MERRRHAIPAPAAAHQVEARAIRYAPGPSALAWPQGLTDFARRAAQRVREWTAAEVAPGRLVPWLAIALGCGTIIYFAVEREPAPWAAA